MKLRWFLSATVREATNGARHVQKLLCAQRDILSPEAVRALENALQDTKGVINSDADKEAIKKQMAQLEKAANKWLKPYPHAVWRENVETLLTVIAVVMAIRTFFVLNFKIPTGSMQPTLFGITVTNLENQPNFTMPAPAHRVYDALVHGTFYHEQLAPEDGEIIDVPRVKSVGINKQPVVVQYRNQVTSTVIPIWFAPDDHFAQAGIYPGKKFTKGSPIFRFQENSGDHLFVNRLTYNFRRPERGEIIVFKTHGITELTERMPSADNQFYIKRLVGLPGESIRVGADRHIYINGERLDSSVPHFENVYSFNPNTPASDSHYSGHTQIFDPSWPSIGDKEIKIREKHYFVCGDNTFSSLDSRFWGDLPEQNVIGKYCFVYWPITDRFGWGQK